MTKLTPGYAVQWEDETGWHQGNVICGTWEPLRFPDSTVGKWWRLIQCPDGLYMVRDDKLQRVETRSD